MSHLLNKTASPVNTEIVGNYIYWLYLLYVASDLLHLPARVPLLAIVRLDLAVFILITIALLLENRKLKGRLNNNCNNILCVLILYIFITLPFVEWPGSVIKNNLTDFVKALAFFFFTILIIDNDKRLKWFVGIFIFCELFRVLEPLYLHIRYNYWGSETYIGSGEFADRLSGAPNDIINPNGLGFVIATVFPFIHYLWSGSGPLVRMTYFAVTPPLFYAMVLTMSRSGFIALSVIGWNILIHSRHKLVILAVAVLAVLLLWTNMTDYQKDRYLSLTGTREARSSATFYGRLSGFSEAFKTIMNKPLVGHGLGTSREANYNVQRESHVTHILYLEIWVELGIIGLIIFMVFLKRIYTTLVGANKELLKLEEQCRSCHEQNLFLNQITYHKKLLQVLISCFWMFIIFSFAQYGLSEFHWYLLAGLSIVIHKKITTARYIMEAKREPTVLASSLL